MVYTNYFSTVRVNVVLLRSVCPASGTGTVTHCVIAYGRVRVDFGPMAATLAQICMCQRNWLVLSAHSVGLRVAYYASGWLDLAGITLFVGNSVTIDLPVDRRVANESSMKFR